MKTQEHTAGAVKAAWVIKCSVRHSSAFDVERAAEVIDRETKLPQLLEALETIEQLLEEGFLVRDTRMDGASDWAIKAFPKIRKLASAMEAIRSAKRETL